MSDRPLFQNSDEQEAAYAPQQLPEGTTAEHAAEVEEGGRNATNAGSTIAVPAAVVAGGAGGTAGSGYSTGAGGTVAGLGPALGAAALGEATAEDDDTADRRT